MSTEYTPTTVQSLHHPVEVEPSDTICAECSHLMPNGRYMPTVEWPCPTIQALPATVTPDPDDARQVEVVNRALCDYTGREPGSRYYEHTARVVLTALAEAVGR